MDDTDLAQLYSRIMERMADVLRDELAAIAETSVIAVRPITPDEWLAVVDWPPGPALVDLKDRATWITLQQAMDLWGVSETTARERCKTRPIAIKPYGVWWINVHRAKTRRGTLPGENRGN